MQAHHILSAGGPAKYGPRQSHWGRSEAAGVHSHQDESCGTSSQEPQVCYIVGLANPSIQNCIPFPQFPGRSSSIPGGGYSDTGDYVWPDQLLAASRHQLHSLPCEDRGGVYIHHQSCSQHGLPELHLRVWQDPSPASSQGRGS